MNAASFNSFIELLDTICTDVWATDATRTAIKESISDTINNLYNYLENDLQ